jgi:hypothetical protein
VIVATAILLAGLLVSLAHAGVGEERSPRLQAGLLQVSATRGRLRNMGRLARRSHPRVDEAEERPEPPSAPVAVMPRAAEGPRAADGPWAVEKRKRRRRRREPGLEDPAEIERLVREQLYGQRRGSG